MDQNDPVLSTIITMTDAFNRGDIAAILRTYEQDAVVVGDPGKPVHGEAALTAMFTRFISAKVAFAYSGHEVVRAGDLALHLAPWRMTGVAPDGTALEARGLSVAVLRRQPDGRWLMVIDQPHGDMLLKASAS